MLGACQLSEFGFYVRFLLQGLVKVGYDLPWSWWGWNDSTR